MMTIRCGKDVIVTLKSTEEGKNQTLRGKIVSVQYAPVKYDVAIPGVGVLHRVHESAVKPDK